MTSANTASGRRAGPENAQTGPNFWTGTNYYRQELFCRRRPKRQPSQKTLGLYLTSRGRKPSPGRLVASSKGRLEIMHFLLLQQFNRAGALAGRLSASPAAPQGCTADWLFAFTASGVRECRCTTRRPPDASFAPVMLAPHERWRRSSAKTIPIVEGLRRCVAMLGGPQP